MPKDPLGAFATNLKRVGLSFSVLRQTFRDLNEEITSSCFGLPSMPNNHLSLRGNRDLELSTAMTARGYFSATQLEGDIADSFPFSSVLYHTIMKRDIKVVRYALFYFLKGTLHLHKHY